MTKIVKSGKRKMAIAKAVLTEGEGKIRINGKDYKNLNHLDKLRISEPIKISEKIIGKLDFDVSVDVSGGGSKGQIEASRLAIARVILEFHKSPELKKAFTEYDKFLLVADTRRKESYKPGDSKARRKRQKSYR